MPRETPLISVIIPAYQAAAFLGRTLDSVLQQGYPALEIIIVDDGSTDATAQVAARAAAGDPRIRFFSQPNQGPAASRNAAVQAARGEYLAFLDADDEWLPGKLQLQADILNQNDAIDFVFTESLEINQDTGARRLVLAGRHAQTLPTLARAALPPYDNVFTVTAASLRPVVFRFGFIQISSTMLRRTLFEQLGRFDPERRGTDDVDLWVRATRVARFAYCAQPLTIHHLGTGNMSRVSAPWLQAQIIHLQLALASPNYADLQREGRQYLRVRYRWLIFFYGRQGQPRQAWQALRDSREAGFDGLNALCALGAWLGPLPFRAAGRLLWP